LFVAYNDPAPATSGTASPCTPSRTTSWASTSSPTSNGNSG